MNSMTRNRSGYDSEHSNQFVSSPKKSQPAPVHVTPRRGQFSGPISNGLHTSPVAVNVSPSGERTIHPIDTVTSSYISTNARSKASDSTNPFASISNELDIPYKSEEETLLKFFKTERGKKTIRRTKTRDQRLATRITLKQMHNQRAKSSRKDVKDASVQTDSPIAAVNRLVEDIGDKRKSVETCCQEVSLSSRVERRSLTLVDKKLESLDAKLLQFIPENIRMLTSFLIMIILIFWLTSIILDVEIPSDFWRIATSYVQSFKWNYFYKQPQTNTEKYWKYLTKLFN